MLIGTATRENYMEIPYKLKIELPYDPTITFLSIYSAEAIIQKDIGTTLFIAAQYPGHGSNLNVHQQRN